MNQITKSVNHVISLFSYQLKFDRIKFQVKKKLPIMFKKIQDIF